MVVFSEKPSLSDRKTYFIWDKPTLSNYCDNGLPYYVMYFSRISVKKLDISVGALLMNTVIKF